ncbi:hypothetical protein GCM10029964_041660 [Kibdelosporangium lantanae]
MDIQVTPDDLRTAGHDLLAVADLLHSDTEALGEQETISAANHGLACLAVSAECAVGWRQSLEVLGGKLAASADTLVLNADSYSAVDAHQAQKFQGR